MSTIVVLVTIRHLASMITSRLCHHDCADWCQSIVDVRIDGDLFSSSYTYIAICLVQSLRFDCAIPLSAIPLRIRVMCRVHWSIMTKMQDDNMGHSN